LICSKPEPLAAEKGMKITLCKGNNKEGKK
jgi:hypothetical protein